MDTASLIALGCILGSFTIVLPAYQTIVGVFGRSGGVDDFRKHLRTCVVEDNCPLGDDTIHRFIEKIVWRLDQRFGLLGLLPATFVWVWITYVHMVVRAFKQFGQDRINDFRPRR